MCVGILVRTQNVTEGMHLCSKYVLQICVKVLHAWVFRPHRVWTQFSHPCFQYFLRSRFQSLVQPQQVMDFLRLSLPFQALPCFQCELIRQRQEDRSSQECSRKQEGIRLIRYFVLLQFVCDTLQRLCIPDHRIRVPVLCFVHVCRHQTFPLQVIFSHFVLPATVFGRDRFTRFQPKLLQNSTRRTAPPPARSPSALPFPACRADSRIS